MQSPNPPVYSMRSRLPEKRATLEVLSVVLFAVFGWSIRGFLYKIPSFTLYFGFGANLAILCYMLAFALLESLLVTGLLAGLATLLPSRFLKEGFAWKGFVIVLVAAIAMIVFEGWYRIDFFKDIMAGDRSSIAPFIVGLLVSIVALVGLLLLVRSQPRLQRVVMYIAEQLSIFTYIYVPLGLIGLVVVVIRNL
jgi:hypothetical protein